MSLGAKLRYEGVTGELARHVELELAWQDRKWGEWEPSSHTPEFWMLIATEEFGEIARAVLENDARATRSEIVDTIAVLTRLWMLMEDA